MRAIILAAGLGSRLRNFKGNIPKILIKIGGRTLLERHLKILSRLGIKDIVIGVGYKSNLVLKELQRLKYTNVELIYNPNFEDGSIVTLQTLAPALIKGGDVIIMDGDVLYDQRILERLINSPYNNCFLLDKNVEPGEEPMKLGIRNGSPVDLRKNLTEPCDYFGESVGFFKFTADTAYSLTQITNEIILSGLNETYMEEAIRHELLSNPKNFAFEDITGLPWIEIDFAKDLVRAEKEILPSIISRN